MPFDNQNELFYLVDEHDNVLGSVPRKVAHHDRSKIHRAVSILLMNDDQLLFQKRSKQKDTFSSYWTVSAGGHVEFGETYEAAARRELKEELGLELPVTLIGKKLFDIESEQEFEAIFRAVYDGSKIQIDETEVADTTWVRREDVKEFIRSNNVTPSAQQELLFAGFIDEL